ncbi:VanW family protein [Cellulomonas alba]|uniref:VanW family protein n=1 Tax=Cellulomonas alba TaxID=3053467 RepID=A0ABT7SJE2_9CELL|nr:VanW family protein [Cellulomonas alba]MDM7855662.1 VanW family protein [Cellulomonas alba]
MADGIDRDDSTPERPAPEAEPTAIDEPAAETAEPPAETRADAEADAGSADGAEADPAVEAEEPGAGVDVAAADEPEPQASDDGAGEPDGEDAADVTTDERGDDARDATAEAEPAEGDDDPADATAEAEPTERDDPADATADAGPTEGDDPADATAEAGPTEGDDDPADATAEAGPTEGDDDPAEADDPAAVSAGSDGDVGGPAEPGEDVGGSSESAGGPVEPTDSDEPSETHEAAAAPTESGDRATHQEGSAEPLAEPADAPTAEASETDEPTAESPAPAVEPVVEPVVSGAPVAESPGPGGTADGGELAEPTDESHPAAPDDTQSDAEPDDPPARAAAATVVMPPLGDAPTVVSPPHAPEPTGPTGTTGSTGPRTEVMTPYGSIAAQAPDKAPAAAPVRTSAFGGRDAAAAPAAGLGATAATAAAASSATPTAQSAAPRAEAAHAAAATATLPPTSAGPALPGARTFEHVPQAERPSSPLDVFEPQRHERRWPRRLGVAAGVLVVLGGAYVGASYALGDKVPRGATVAGVEIGGLSSAQAVAALDAQLDGATGKAIPVTVHGTSSSLDPAKAGLTFDADATVARLTGVDLSAPIRLWDHLVGVGDQPAVAAVDEAKLSAAVQALGRSTGKKAVDGSIVFVDGSAHETAAKDGWALDEDAARDVVRTSWLSGARPLDLPSKTVAPTVTGDETDRAMSEIAEPLTGAPVSVQVDGKLAVLQPLQLAAAATIAPKDGSLQLTMDGAKLRAAVLTQLPDLLTQPADASFAFKDDKPVLVPGKAGTQLDPATLATAVAGAAVADNRTVDVALTPTQPEDSTDALQKLGITEIVSEFSTPLTAEKIRDINIKQGAKNITGTLIKPGETFSLGKALGEVDAAHGFVDAGAIVDGEHTDAMGGGLSQLSTTTYNAAYFAGFQILEHHPHSEWFARYPEGRESTLFLPSMDMRWKNNTPTGALVQAWVANNRTYVRIWGTKYWTVQSTTGPRSGVVQPTTRYSQSKTCEPAAAGNPGFTVTVTRRTSLGGQLKDTSSYTTRYKPQDKVVCGKAPTSAKSSAG